MIGLNDIHTRAGQALALHLEIWKLSSGFGAVYGALYGGGLGVLTIPIPVLPLFVVGMILGGAVGALIGGLLGAVAAAIGLLVAEVLKWPLRSGTVALAIGSLAAGCTIGLVLWGTELGQKVGRFGWLPVDFVLLQVPALTVVALGIAVAWELLTARSRVPLVPQFVALIRESTHLTAGGRLRTLPAEAVPAPAATGNGDEATPVNRPGCHCRNAQSASVIAACGGAAQLIREREEW